MKLAYTAESLIDAQLVIDALRMSGIPCLLHHSHAVGGFGDLPVTYPEVWVRRAADLPKARRAITAIVNRALPADNRDCATCNEKNPATFDICWRCYTPLG